MSQSRPVPRQPPPSPKAHHYLVGCPLSALAGVALAIQSRINGDYGRLVKSGVTVALISFGSSLAVCLVLLSLVAARGALPALIKDIRVNRLPPWFYLGGLAGAFTIFSQGLAVTALGVAVFTVSVVAGQSLSSLFVDWLGVGPAGKQPATVYRLAGTGLAIVAAIVSVSSQFHNTKSLALVALPALAGIGTPWHQALNGRIRVATGSTLAPTTINFLVGTSALAIAFLVDVVIEGLPRGTTSTPWPGYVGGPLGVTFIAITVTVVRYIGVLTLALSTIAGQLVAAIVLDLVAPEVGSHSDLPTFIGAGLTIVAVAICVMHPRRHRGG